MIQINREWRIKEAGDNFILEKLGDREWHYRASSIGIVGVLRSYVYDRYVLEPTDTPQALIALLRKLTAEIEAAVKEIEG